MLPDHVLQRVLFFGLAWGVLAAPSPLSAQEQSTKLQAPRQQIPVGEIVRCVAFSPDGKTLASGSDDKTIRLWDAASGTQRTSLTGHTDWVWSLAYSADGTMLASVSKDRTIKLWDVETGLERANLTRDTDWQCGVAFSPDGKTLAQGSSDRTIKLWDVQTARVRSRLKWRKDWLAEQVAALPKEEAALAYSPDGKMLASQNVDMTIHLWNPVTGKVGATFNEQGLRGGSPLVAYSSNGKMLASNSGGGFVLWNLRSGKEIANFEVSLLHSLAFSPDGNTVASGDQNGIIKLWRVWTGKDRATIVGHKGTIWSLAFSPDGKILASGSHDKTIKLWDAENE